METNKSQSNAFDDNLVSLDNIPKLTVISLKELLTTQYPPLENLLEPWLPEKGLAMLYAPRGIGKTLIALHIAYTVATAGKFLSWQANKPKGVLYIDGEMPIQEMQKRMQDITLAKTEDTKVKFLTADINPDIPFNLNDCAFQQAIDKTLDENTKLIIIDNISTLCASHFKEDTADSWQIIQQWCLKMRTRGYSLLFIHHAGKSGKQRGTSKREDIMDTVISLRNPENHSASDGVNLELNFEKNRRFYGQDAASLAISFKDNKWQHSPITSTQEQVHNLLAQGKKQSDIAQELNINKSSVSRYAKSYVAS